MTTNDDSKQTSVFTAVSLYWIVSITLVFLNKVMMSGELFMDAPIFLTWTQLIAAATGSYILSLLRQDRYFSFFPAFEYKSHLAIKVMPLTIVFLGMVIFNNLCLKYVQVAFYQVARSLTIVFNVLFTKWFLGENTSRPALISVVVVVLGYIVGVDGEVQYSKLGVFYGVSASAFVALNAIYVKKTMGIVSDKWLLMIYTNINGIILMPVIFILGGELPEIMNSTAYFESKFWMILIISGIFGFLINIVTFIQIQVTSPLTHNISGTAKAAAQTLLACMAFGDSMSFMGAVGVFLVLAGSLLYAYIRMREEEIGKKKYEPIPMVTVQPDDDSTAGVENQTNTHQE